MTPVWAAVKPVLGAALLDDGGDVVGLRVWAGETRHAFCGPHRLGGRIGRRVSGSALGQGRRSTPRGLPAPQWSVHGEARGPVPVETPASAQGRRPTRLLADGGGRRIRAPGRVLVLEADGAGVRGSERSESHVYGQTVPRQLSTRCVPHGRTKRLRTGRPVTVPVPSSYRGGSMRRCRCSPSAAGRGQSSCRRTPRQTGWRWNGTTGTTRLPQRTSMAASI